MHVVRGGRDVFALSDAAARVWRTVVFRRPLAQIAAADSGTGHRSTAPRWRSSCDPG
ncbi:hypothetical protein [Tsukamurella sp. PLM1]|uniref:hypothetical protein n=1 Tax=Tsukamurella sp. PLM1 TaxID=2929795 RepID=UPI0020C16BC3|nr:hypothetical protein [Tsukamurella sp. PLM1]